MKQSESENVMDAATFNVSLGSHMKDSLNNSSKTDWERIDALTDDEIDTSDAPPLTADFFAKARWLMPGESVSQRKDLQTKRD